MSRQFIQIICRRLLLKSKSSYFLDILPLDDDSKIIYDQIHLLLLLDQLQYLIVENIFDYTIIYKRKIYFYIDQ